MARKKAQPRSNRLIRWWRGMDKDQQRAWLMRTGYQAAAAGMLVAVVVCLVWMDHRLHASPRFQEPPAVHLLDVPDGLREIMVSKLEPIEQRDGFDKQICRKIGHSLETDPWVREVKYVKRLHNLDIAISCDYRTPAALVYWEGDFYLIDEQRVRLPGVYRYDDSLPLIQGVADNPPPPGEVWRADDLKAGLELAQFIEQEPYVDQITGILVQNYGGRYSSREPHIELATDRAGGRIKWGSAPGKEVEENTVEQKLSILRHNYDSYGRADAGLRVIDISVYPDRFTAEG